MPLIHVGSQREALLGVFCPWAMKQPGQEHEPGPPPLGGEEKGRVVFRHGPPHLPHIGSQEAGPASGRGQ